MKKTVHFFAITLLALQVNGQTGIQTKEVKIPYINGYMVFRVCESGCRTVFDDNKDYYWYTDFAKIKKTKGGSGGSLLHGNYKFYDENGNLRTDMNYYLGLPDGTEKTWDSLGNITTIVKYNKGDMIYWKFQNEKKYWIEWTGSPMVKGSVKKSYSQYKVLLSEESYLPNFRVLIKTYYETSHKLEQEYTSSEFGGGVPELGKYIAYFENGNIETEGQYDENDTASGIRIGTWKYYKEDGSLDTTIKYKADIEYWDNGRIKQAGGYIYDGVSNTWLKTGWWRWFTENGEIIHNAKTYKFGVEVDEKGNEIKQ